MRDDGVARFMGEIRVGDPSGGMLNPHHREIERIGSVKEENCLSADQEGLCYQLGRLDHKDTGQTDPNGPENNRFFKPFSSQKCGRNEHKSNPGSRNEKVNIEAMVLKPPPTEIQCDSARKKENKEEGGHFQIKLHDYILASHCKVATINLQEALQWLR
jgi:hypothetical protein